MFTKQKIKEFFLIIIGVTIVAAAVYFFMLPSNVTVGSGTALAMVVSMKYMAASMKYVSVNRNVDPAMDLAWNISSVMEIIISTELSLMLTMNSLPTAGKAFFIA